MTFARFKVLRAAYDSASKLLGVGLAGDGDEGDDATIEGAFIGADKVAYLREQLRETGGNEAAFLAMAGAAKL